MSKYIPIEGDTEITGDWLIENGFSVVDFNTYQKGCLLLIAATFKKQHKLKGVLFFHQKVVLNGHTFNHGKALRYISQIPDLTTNHPVETITGVEDSNKACEKSWAKLNSALPQGINLHPYSYGWRDGVKRQAKQVHAKSIALLQEIVNTTQKDEMKAWIDKHQSSDPKGITIREYFARMSGNPFPKLNEPLISEDELQSALQTMKDEKQPDLQNVTRVEVIDGKGRSYVNWNKGNKVEISMQDEGRTMKVFITT